MSWIDDRIAERNALRSRKDNIATNAPKLYDALWAQIIDYIEEARGKSFEVITNGSPYERIVAVPVAPSTGETSRPRREIRVRLAKDKGSIIMSGTGDDLEFDIGVDPNGVVCLEFAGDCAPIEKAAAKILDRLLFPELPSRL